MYRDHQAKLHSTPICFFDYYLHEMGECQPCPSKEYSLKIGDTRCYEEDDAPWLAEVEWKKKLEYLVLYEFASPGEDTGDSGNGWSQQYNYYTTTSEWSIALLVVIASCSLCSIGTIVIFVCKKRMNSQREQQRVQDGISQDEVEGKLTKVKSSTDKKLYEEYRNNEYFISTCAICCDDFTDKDKIRITACNHAFHSKCLLQWAIHKINQPRGDKTPDCPYCKTNLMLKKEEIPFEAGNHSRALLN